jgi:tetratricopeptide (TPR) repeat protein
VPAAAALAKTALAELTVPDAYYLPLAKRLFRDGDAAAALKELDTGLQAMPNNARLLAARALLRLESFPEGKMTDEAKQLVRQDAEAAKKDAKVAPEALYVLGRLEEQLGQYDKAEANYQQALQAAPDNTPEKDRYRAALARLLQRPRQAALPNEASLLTPDTTEQERLLEALMVTLACVQPPGDDEKQDVENEKRLQESIKLAKEMLKSPDPKTRGEGHMILGLAYLKLNDRNKAMTEYVKGLEMYHPGAATTELFKMVQDHPAFQQVDIAAQADPQVAARYFGKGLEFFWARRYPEAEKEFYLATQYNKLDARYQYYLGMALLQQKGKKKREQAENAFLAGRSLEAASRPDSVQINASLERLQGDMRRVLNDYRQRPLAAPQN